MKICTKCGSDKMKKYIKKKFTEVGLCKSCGFKTVIDIETKLCKDCQ